MKQAYRRGRTATMASAVSAFLTLQSHAPGAGLDNATWGPYFGRNEQEMMVVTDRGFFITTDGAKSWKHVAPYFAVPDGYATARGYDAGGGLRYFGWDSVQNSLYASCLGAPVCRPRVRAD